LNVKDFLTIPMARGVDLDRPEAAVIHRSIIQNKKFLYRLYEDFYGAFAQEAASVSHLPGRLLELGSGGGFLKEKLPNIVTSEVCKIPLVDQVIDANNLPFGKEELRGIFMLNVLHHLPKPRSFFREATRCLVRGGRVVLIEPFNSWFGKWVYTRFHHEPFDDQMSEWESLDGGRMSTSNQALPWIIFWRDKHVFEKEFPELKILKRTPHTALGYLLSGGMTWRSLVPGLAYPLASQVDRILSKWNRFFPMFQTIVLEKQ